VIVPLDELETNIVELRRAIQNLEPGGGTALYDGVVEVVQEMNSQTDDDRIRAVVLLSDGEDTRSDEFNLREIERTITETRNELNPVIVVPVGYGSLNDELIRVLERIAAASNTTWQSGDPENIGRVLELISSFF
jgi:Ca-activated chloride channel homolog